MKASSVLVAILEPNPKVDPSLLNSPRDDPSRPNPGFGIFEANGKVPIPEDDEVEAAEVGLGK